TSGCSTIGRARTSLRRAPSPAPAVRWCRSGRPARSASMPSAPRWHTPSWDAPSAPAARPSPSAASTYRRPAWSPTPSSRSGCRGAFDASDRPSLDAIALGLFGTPTPPLLIALPAIGEQAAHVLDSVKLISTLTVDPAGLPSQYIITHTLVSALFGANASAEV